MPGGPWHLAFAPKQLENLSFPIEIIYWASWISHVQSTGLPLFFLRAKPCLKNLVEGFHQDAHNQMPGPTPNSLPFPPPPPQENQERGHITLLM